MMVHHHPISMEGDVWVTGSEAVSQAINSALENPLIEENWTLCCKCDVM